MNVDSNQLEKIACNHKHIDNGGVTVEIHTRTLKDGYREVYLHHDAQYFGYPGIRTELRIDYLGPNWLREIGMMYLSAAAKLEPSYES